MLFRVPRRSLTHRTPPVQSIPESAGNFTLRFQFASRLMVALFSDVNAAGVRGIRHDGHVPGRTLATGPAIELSAGEITEILSAFVRPSACKRSVPLCRWQN